MIARLLPAAVALCAAAVLVSLAVPRFVAGAIVAPYEDLTRAIARGASVPMRDIDAAREAANVSLGWLKYGRTLTRLGALELVHAGQVKTAAEQAAALARGQASLRAGLARTPGESYHWLQLAQTVQATGGATPALNAPLRMSLRTGAYDHRLILPRLAIAFRAWPALDADVRAAMTPQIRRAVDTAPAALARLTRRSFALRHVRQALEGSPVHAARFAIVWSAPL